MRALLAVLLFYFYFHHTLVLHLLFKTFYFMIFVSIGLSNI